MKKNSLFYILSIILSVLNTSLYAQYAGMVDTTFDTAGFVSIDVADYNYIEDIIIQSDGKIYTGGYMNNFGSRTDFLTTRHLADGSYDVSYSFDGIKGISLSSLNDEGHQLALQPDGKIVLGGYAEFNATNSYDVVMTRIHTNGATDNSFGSIGKVQHNISPGTGSSKGDLSKSVLLQPDGKLLSCGHTNTAYNTDFFVARLNSDGTMDSTFGTNGISTLDLSNSSHDRAESAILQPDGKIIVAGYTVSGSEYDFAMARFNSDGSLDATFGINGIVISDFGAPNDIAHAIALQSDGKIILGGYSYASSGSYHDMAMIRYNSDGSIDASFGSGGYVITSYATNIYSRIRSIVVHENGKIIVAGDYLVTDYRIIVAQYNSDGSLDTSFGNTGFTTPVLLGYDEVPQVVKLDNQGQILVAGHYDIPNGINGFILKLKGECEPYVTQEPTNVSSCLDENVSFSVIAGAVENYQWQVDSGSGFINLTNSGNYSDVNSNQLQISNIQRWMENYDFRCVLSGSCGSDTSQTVQISLNISESIDTVSACNTYTWIDGNNYNSNNYSATYTLTNQTGCDSIISLHLTMYSTPNVVASGDTTICKGTTVNLNASGASTYNWNNGAGSGNLVSVTPVSTTTYTVTGNSNSCTATDQVTIIVKQPSTYTDVQSACDSFLWIDGNTYYSDNNTATQIVTNSEGCDSTITLDLTIDDVNTPVITNMNGVLITYTYDNYQWYLDSLPIAGATSQTLTPTKNGAYWVEVSNTSGCTATSEVFTVDNINELGIFSTDKFEINIFPNPSSGMFRIQGDVKQYNKMRVLDFLGHEVQSQVLNTKEISLDLTQNPKGIYVVQLINEKSILIRKITRN